MRSYFYVVRVVVNAVKELCDGIMIDAYGGVASVDLFGEMRFFFLSFFL